MIEKLILAAIAAGVQNSYEFAEWLVDEKSHFGPTEDMDQTDLESAWLEAQNWWEIHAAKARERVG